MINSSLTSIPARPYDTRRAAEYLGVSASILNKWRLDGRGPEFRKFGSRVVYMQSDLDAFANLKRRRSTSDEGGRAA